MKDEDLSRLANRIRQELTELDYVLARMSEGWARARCATINEIKDYEKNVRQQTS